ncbi:uncharacterized protein BDZ99DRAFT_510646 [Mytilinidion resinicola]|uniref:Uncharacterized protein n=1 Tax=Mytilinidion resinicola TaxID=574789 RepID=A0A6A6YC42_9PEZI|nr:uncharacterized protein BDZ99DRAFT_510646 [Mytilinidion resinicola]KAF2806179.1 hypothetical protein BDZ99DRAFT_510646 [Mytilinidion resinicola]
MRSSTIIAAFAAVGSAMAQRPASTPICDYYTAALLKNNTAANQYTLLTLLVNTAVIGNYTTPNVGIAANGILNNGTYKGEPVSLLQYFDGALESTNFNGKAIAVNFLDGGGAAPLLLNMPANNTSSIQYGLITHLYQFFGALLSCSEYGAMGFPSYKGKTSMAEVHRFMDLEAAEVGYFIEQVGLSAASFGVTNDDVTAVGTALTKLFDYKCAPPVAILPNGTAELQSICQAEDCPVAPNATCAAYPLMGMPTSPANASVTVMPTGTVAPSATTSTASMFTGAAQAIGAGVGSVAAAGLFALALAL